MKIKFMIMVALFCFSQTAINFGQIRPESGFVKYIVLETDPNPRFVWSFANSIISLGKMRNEDEISCLKGKLMKTGLFSTIEDRLVKLDEPYAYELVLTINYDFSEPDYKVNKIEIKDLKDVDESKFKKQVGSENLIGKSVSLRLDYNDFEDKLFELLKKSLTDASKKGEFKLPWVELKVNEHKDLEVILMPYFEGCENSK